MARDLLKILADNVKHYRTPHRQEDLARLANVDIEVVRRVEQGRGWPEYKNLIAIARALGVEASALFFPGEPPHPPKPIEFEHAIDECYRRIGEALKKNTQVPRHRSE